MTSRFQRGRHGEGGEHHERSWPKQLQHQEIESAYSLLKDPNVAPGRYGILGENVHTSLTHPYPHRDAWDITKHPSGKLTPRDQIGHHAVPEGPFGAPPYTGPTG
jgi:hypothetical protein